MYDVKWGKTTGTGSTIRVKMDSHTRIYRLS